MQNRIPAFTGAACVLAGAGDRETDDQQWHVLNQELWRKTEKGGGVGESGARRMATSELSGGRPVEVRGHTTHTSTQKSAPDRGKSKCKGQDCTSMFNSLRTEGFVQKLMPVAGDVLCKCSSSVSDQ